MGFEHAKRQILDALRAGAVEHDVRGEGKNLLALGLVDVTAAIELIERTRGQEARASAHHADPSVEVWVFRPRGWYIKFYHRRVWRFASFHREGEP